MNNVCVCVCVRANVDECSALEEHYIWWALNIGRGRTLSRKLKCQCVENIPTFRIALVQLGCGANTRTHTAQQRQHYFTRNTIAKRYQTISLKLLTFPISLISLSSITGCGSSSAFFHNRAPEKCTSEWDGAGWRAASVAERVRESEKNGKRANEYHGHIWTSEWKFCK